MNEQDKKLCEELRFQTRYAVGIVPVTMDKAAQAIERLSGENEVLSNSSRVSYDAFSAVSNQLDALKAELRAIARAINDDRLDLSYTAVQIIEEMKAVLKAQGEPVAWMIHHEGKCMGFLPNKEGNALPVYLHPPVVSEDAKDACHWRQEDEDGAWGGSCGVVWSINEGIPSENSMKFCCHCGRPLVEHPWVYPEDDAAIDKAMEGK